jgi:uncharacterized membrane protein YjjP (DUF1212 family)
LGGVDWDLERLCLLEDLVDDIKDHKLDTIKGLEILNHITTLPLRYSTLMETTSNIILALGYAILFGLTWAEVFVHLFTNDL